MEKYKDSINHIKIACAPMRLSDFYLRLEDKVFKKNINSASLYVISKRDKFYFTNINIDSHYLIVEILQTSENNKVSCRLDLRNFSKGNDLNNITVGFKYFNDSHSNIKEIYIQENGDIDHFIITPENLIFDILLNNNIKSEISGDIKSFLKYEVLYVGQSTEQNILDRLNGHKKLQQIIANREDNSNYEISILVFDFEDNLSVNDATSFTPADFEKLFTDQFKSNKKKVFLDAEKALVKFMSPEYNEILFAKYPKSEDGLYDSFYNNIIYTFVDPITLKYKNGEIKGGDSFGVYGDMLLVTNSNVFLLNSKNSSNYFSELTKRFL